jgi:large subunit ribosomal protein L5
MSQLKDRYQNQVKPELKSELGLTNDYGVPSLVKVLVTVGIGAATQNAKLQEEIVTLITRITGQKPVLTRAKKSIAGFKVREGMPVGVMVTLRGEKMYDFLGKMVNVVLPRLRDFRGLSSNTFDGRGNFSLGFKDLLVFPEVDFDALTHPWGLTLTVVTSATTDEQGHLLASKLGFPFKEAKAL